MDSVWLRNIGRLYKSDDMEFNTSFQHRKMLSDTRYCFIISTSR